MKSFLASLRFLTRLRGLPLRPGREGLLLSILWFPVIGGLVGLGLALLHVHLLVEVWPEPLAVGLLLLIMVWVKDGFHLDGLSDLVDGLYGGETPSDIYSIMKDSALGPFGALAMMAVLAFEYGALIELNGPELRRILPFVLALSSGGAGLVLCWGSRLLESDGLAAFFIRRRRWWFQAVITVVMLLVGGLCFRWVGVILAAATLPITYGLIVSLQWRLGGVNGDCCGAIIMILQVLLLMVMVPLSQGQLLSYSSPLSYPW